MAEETQQPTTQPTMEDLQAIANKAMQAAQEAKDEVAAGKAASSAAKTEGESRGLDLPPELLQQIADAMSGQVVEKLRAEFELAQSNPTPVPSGPDATTPKTGTVSTDASSNPDPSPGGKTFAERFLGG